MKVAIVTYRKLFETIPFATYDVVIATDESAELLLAQGTAFDYAIGDFDSIDEEQLYMLDTSQVSVHKLDTHKDVTDTQAAIDLAVERGATSIDIYTSFGGRVDQQLTFIGFLNNAAVLGIDMKLYFDSAEMELLLPGNYQFKPSAPLYVSFVALEEVFGLDLTGVAYPLVDANIKLFSDFTVSNELSADTLGVSFRQGKLLFVQIFEE